MSIDDLCVPNLVKDGSYYVDPPECALPGFYEDYFDGVPSAVETFQKMLRELTRDRGGDR